MVTRPKAWEAVEATWWMEATQVGEVPMCEFKQFDPRAHQLEEWVRGNPEHDKINDRCCPDHSCCDGDLAEKSLRLEYLQAYRDGEEGHTVRIRLKAGFLAKCLLKKFSERISQ